MGTTSAVSAIVGKALTPPEKLSTIVRYLCVLVGGMCVSLPVLPSLPKKTAPHPRGWVERRGLQGPLLADLSAGGAS